MSKFQIILLAIFGVFIVGAVLIFSLSRGSSTQTANLTVWGPLKSFEFGALTSALSLEKKGYLINYVEEPATSFDADFTEALAEGKGPDIVLLGENQLWQEKNKLSLIPYTSVSQKDYLATFIEEGNLFATTQGIYALPLFVDPLVLYTNRDLLDSAALAVPIKYWDEIYTFGDKLTTKDPAGNITQSTLALGEARNIPHSKDILALLMLQAGTPITDFQGTQLQAELLNNYNLPLIPADSALDFYTQFANPAKPFYDWNRSLPNAEVSFYSGDSAFYLGFASELSGLKSKNPNVNIGLTTVPQSRASGKTVTLGRLYGLAISKNSPNQAAALTAALDLISNPAAAALSKQLSLPPARRDLLSVKPSDGVQAVFYDAALYARGWLDPNASKSNTIFMNLIESITSGRAAIDTALNTANNALNTLIKSS